jgi:prevent-host-death family protein
MQRISLTSRLDSRGGRMIQKFCTKLRSHIVAAKNLSVSEARKQFSRLVDGVSRGRTALTITQHGKGRAALIGINQYHELSQKAEAYDRIKKKSKPFTVKGSLELRCSSEELIEEMRRIRARWAESIQRSSEELARERFRK